MTQEYELSPPGAWILPTYFGTDASGSIVGISSEPGVELLSRMLDGVFYQQALREGSVALLGQLTPRYSRLESWTAFEELRQQTEHLMGLPETDDLGRVRPDSSAVAEAIEVLFRAFDSGAPLSKDAEVCTDAEGAIHLLWEVGQRTLELICPFDGASRPHIYFSDSKDHRLAFDLSKPRLRRLFSWLSGWVSEFPR